MAMTLEEEKTEFYSALGEAMSSWSSVEVHLYLIFVGCLSPADHTVAAAVYYATESFRTKLNLTDAAVQVVMKGEPELEEWNDLREWIRKKSTKRNALAHHDVLINTRRRGGRRYLLAEPLIDPLREERGTLLAPHGLGFKELRERSLSFAQAASRLACFHTSLGKGAIYYVKRKGFTATRPVRKKP